MEVRGGRGTGRCGERFGGAAGEGSAAAMRGASGAACARCAWHAPLAPTVRRFGASVDAVPVFPPPTSSARAQSPPRPASPAPRSLADGSSDPLTHPRRRTRPASCTARRVLYCAPTDTVHRIMHPCTALMTAILPRPPIPLLKSWPSCLMWPHPLSRSPPVSRPPRHQKLIAQPATSNRHAHPRLGSPLVAPVAPAHAQGRRVRRARRRQVVPPRAPA